MLFYGVPVTDDDARTLVDLLLRVGGARELSAAAAILRGLPAESLTPAERDAILDVLDEAPDGLTALRGVLARDQCDRRR